MTYYIIRNDELYHHGILGQKWGVRRYQNEDGSLTSAGKKRYRAGYLNDGEPSDEESNDVKKINNKKKLAKVLIIAGGLTLATAAGYAFYKRGKSYIDHTIAPETMLRNINTIGMMDLKAKDAVYVSSGKINAAKYKEWYVRTKKNNIHETIIKPSDELKIAGVKTAHEAFSDLVNSDSEFKNHVKELVNALADSNITQSSVDKDVSKLFEAKKVKRDIAKGDINSKSVYKLYNMALTSPDPRIREQAKKFYGALKQKGYSGLSDYHDRVRSHIDSNADIIFDKTKNFKISTRKVGAGELVSSSVMAKLFANIKSASPLLGFASVGLGGTMAYNIKQNENKIVDEYIKQHPNSELSPKEILENYYGKK